MIGGVVRPIAARMRAAARTNEPQVNAVTGLTLLMGVTLAGSGHASPLAWVLALAFWPTIAFLFNLVDPIPASSTNRRQTDGH